MQAFIPTVASLVFAVGFATVAHGQATINDCEKIQAADAYNQCLAKFGPPAKTLNMEGPRPGDVKSGSADAAATGGKGGGAKSSRVAGRRNGRGRPIARRGRGGARATRVTRGRGGRKRMLISVGK